MPPPSYKILNVLYRATWLRASSVLSVLPSRTPFNVKDARPAGRTPPRMVNGVRSGDTGSMSRYRRAILCKCWPFWHQNRSYDGQKSFFGTRDGQKGIYRMNILWWTPSYYTTRPKIAKIDHVRAITLFLFLLMVKSSFFAWFFHKVKHWTCIEQDQKSDKTSSNRTFWVNMGHFGSKKSFSTSKPRGRAHTWM